MGSRYKEDEHAICPFYRKESYTEIKCEGLIGTHTTNTFANRKEKEHFKSDFCSGFYWNCKMYRILFEKYGGSLS